MRWELCGNFIVLVLGPGDVDAAGWDGFVQMVDDVLLRKRRVVNGVVVRALADAAPSALQRRNLTQVFERHGGWYGNIAVITDSGVGKTVVSLMGRLSGQRYRGFSSSQIDDALSFAGARQLRADVLDTIERLRG